MSNVCVIAKPRKGGGGPCPGIGSERHSKENALKCSPLNEKQNEYSRTFIVPFQVFAVCVVLTLVFLSDYCAVLVPHS